VCMTCYKMHQRVAHKQQLSYCHNGNCSHCHSLFRWYNVTVNDFFGIVLAMKEGAR
jgi:hypothetical protein